jgi:hypothetical protein
MIDRAAVPVRFPIDNKYVSFDSRGFAKVRRGSIYFHAGTPSFEAEVVKGVEDAEDSDEGEVRTHEVPQDDVPGEYRDKEE